MALEDGGTRFPSMVLVIPIRRLAGVPGLNPSIAIEAFEPSKMGKNFSPKLGNLGLADFVFRHGCRHRRDLNVEFGLLAFGSLTLARGLEHVYPRLVLMQLKIGGMRWMRLTPRSAFGCGAVIRPLGRDRAPQP